MAGPWRHPIPRALRRPKQNAAWLARRARGASFEALLARARAMQGGEPAPSPPPGATPDEAFPEVTGPVTMGINTPLFYTATKYGRPMDLVDDMARLGANVLRHPGHMQLFIDHLLYPWTAGDPVPGEPLRTRMIDAPINRVLVESSDEQLDSILEASFPLHYLGGLCRHLQAIGGRGPPWLILTWLDFGQGAPTDWGRLVGEGVVRAPPSESDRQDPILMPWAEDTIGHEVEHIVTGDIVSVADDNEWNRYTLDPRSAYKWAFYARLAGALGRWLERRWDVVGNYVKGVEICNEVEDFHVAVDARGDRTPDGSSWGDLYYDCAVELRRACPMVPLWLPGLASYAAEMDPTSRDPKAWEGKKLFVRYLLRQVRARCASDGGLLSDLVDGIDLHYYHMGQQAEGSDRPQALAHLAVALRELREVVEDEEFDWDSVQGPDVPLITCIENSTNVMAASDLGDAPFASVLDDVYPTRMEALAEYPEDVPDSRKLRASERPPIYKLLVLLGPSFMKVGNSVGTLDFQGQSVWMRLSVAMLGGAQFVGWHCPIGIYGDAFEGTGLRYDLHSNDASASLSGMRPSWWAFREFARTLAPASTVRRLAPERLRASTTMAGITADFGAEDMLWVIEFERATALPGLARGYAYLAFLDPFWPVSSSDPRPVGAELNFSAARTGSLRVSQRPTWPSGATTLVSSPSEGYPIETWPAHTPAGRVGVSPSGSRMVLDPVTVALGRYPLLLASPQQLTLDSLTVVTE